MGRRLTRAGQRRDAVDEAWPSDAQLHGLRIVAIGARDRVRVALLLEPRVRSLVAQRRDDLEALHDIATASLAVGGDDRGMAMQTGARLRLLAHALGLLLVR